VSEAIRASLVQLQKVSPRSPGMAHNSRSVAQARNRRPQGPPACYASLLLRLSTGPYQG